MKLGEKLIIDIKDDTDKRVVFTERKRKQKALQHAELNNNTFIKNIVKTIESPQEVWEDYSDKKHKACYYKKYSPTSYVKVVIWLGSNPYEVITAYEINKIKESDYSNLKRLR